MGQMMKTVTKSAHAGEHGESLDQVKQRFALWRESRTRGEHISGALWAAAVGMVELHGLQHTAKELRVDHGRLKKRHERGAGAAPADKVAPKFVEMFVPPVFPVAPMAACVVLMENGNGGKMRVELNNLEGLAALSSAFWNVR
ncbi:MAG: hypothetical protein H7315_17240 [Herminiimonas sp.]|nr:hypothetical protein [Herminiimonas sp.]